jgi:hypothetical protein
LVFFGSRRLTRATALALVMPGGLASRRPPDRAPSAIAAPEVHGGGGPQDLQQLLAGLLRAARGGVARGQPVAAAAEAACDLAHVHGLGTQGALRPFGHLAEVGYHVYAGDGTQLVYGLLRVELGRSGPLVVGVLHGEIKTSP